MEHLKNLLEKYINEKKELLSRIRDDDWKNEIKIQLETADLFKSMIKISEKGVLENG